MATTASTSLASSAPMPAFSLPDVVTGKAVTRDHFVGAKAALVIFLCRHCPYVVHVREELSRIASEFAPRGLVTIGISANDAEAYPDDAPENLAAMVRDVPLSFPVLFDASQDVARAFGAECTPDIFLYGPELSLAYRGRLDESTPGNGKPLTGSELRTAIEALIAGRPLGFEPKPSIGCSIKWKPGRTA